MCGAGIGWNDLLTDQLLERWKLIQVSLAGADSICIPRCFLSHTTQSVRLVAFADASTKAYAAVVYLRMEFDSNVRVRFMAAITRVTPLKSITIPRLELLSALLLSKLIVNVHTALMSEIPLDHDHTDSKVALHWVRGNDCEWKQFGENRVISVRSLVPSEHWRHCLGISNPADIPSRGMLPSELSECQLWLNVPDWLYTPTYLTNSNSEEIIPEECQQELK